MKFDSQELEFMGKLFKDISKGKLFPFILKVHYKTD